MKKTFKCLQIVESENGFSVAFALVTNETTTDQAKGNINLSALTKTEAAEFKVGKSYTLAEVTTTV